MSDSTRPLVSVIVPVYRHQPYLVPALESILAFDYSPLEIIIQDDASPDDAFEVIKRVVASYDGPHKVVIGKNEKNHSMGNFNVLMEKVSGDYIVAAHDDDIQYPDRITRIMDAFLTHKVSMVTSNSVCITAAGFPLGADCDPVECRIDAVQFSKTGWTNHVHGAALSWHRDVFDAFGPIDTDGTARASDFIIPYRAALLDGIYYLSIPLLDRRRHAESRGSIGTNTNEVDVLAVERNSEAITQYVYMLKTTATAHQKSLIADGQLKVLTDNIRALLVEKAELLAVSRNRLHMKKLRMIWIPHKAGAVTGGDLHNAEASKKALSMFATRIRHRDLPAQLRSRKAIIEAVRGQPWKQVALQHPFKIRYWLAVRRLQNGFQRFGKDELSVD